MDLIMRFSVWNENTCHQWWSQFYSLTLATLYPVKLVPRRLTAPRTSHCCHGRISCMLPSVQLLKHFLLEISSVRSLLLNTSWSWLCNRVTEQEVAGKVTLEHFTAENTLFTLLSHLHVLHQCACATQPASQRQPASSSVGDCQEWLQDAQI